MTVTMNPDCSFFRSNCTKEWQGGVLPILLMLLTFVPATLQCGLVVDTTLQPKPASRNVLDTLWHDVMQSASDGVLLFSAPVQMHASGWAITGGVVVGTAALIEFADDPMRRVFAKGHTSLKDQLNDAGNLFGTGAPGGIVALGLYSGGLIFDSHDLRLAGRHIIQSLVYAGLATTTLKYLIGRERPYLNGGPFAFHGPNVSDSRNSLPSGHTTVAFAVCSSLSADIDNPWATVGLYSIATLTAAARMYSDRHWASDVFLAAAIGTACGYGTVHLHDAVERSGSSLYLIPAPSSLTLAWQF